MEQLTYKTESFEGPLDLLLSLIMKNKMDICDIRISVIFDQYMEYLEQMKAMDMEIAGEFIVMASELMFIKSRMLLPRTEENEEDPRERLAQALLEYRRAKEAARYFEDQFALFGRRMTKETDELPSDDHYVAPQDLKLLEEALARLFVRRENRTPEPFSSISPIIHKVIVPMPDMLRRVVQGLHRAPRVRFEELFSEACSRGEIVATFLALLTLMKDGHVRVDAAYEPTDEQTDGYTPTLFCSLTDPQAEITIGDSFAEYE